MVLLEKAYNTALAVFKECLELHNPFSPSHPLHGKLFPIG